MLDLMGNPWSQKMNFCAYLDTLQKMRSTLIDGIGRQESDLLKAHEMLKEIEKEISIISNTNDRKYQDQRVPLKKRILSVIEKNFYENEFSVSEVEKCLLDGGYVIKGKNPRARIAMELKKLIKDGNVSLAQIGVGSIPHLYRKA
ncbi:hypothetical protein L5556_000380 [Pseudomonas aeruginosa]|nr:hypothetical protein [Pseudomonas aeruginosa]